MSNSFVELRITILTVSDTRSEATDTSGDQLARHVSEAGHQLVNRRIVKDDIYQIRAVTSAWIADPAVQVVLITGGTGFSGRDSTPEAMLPLFDKEVLGFGELFRALSWDDVGSSTVQSRATAGIANRTLVFCLPGSPGACRTAWQKIIEQQLDSRHKPCNFAAYLDIPISEK